MKRLLISLCIAIFINSFSYSQGNWKLVDSISYTGTVYGIDVSFVSDSVGYFADYYNNHIYKTNNKGESWNAVGSSGGDLRSLEFANDTIGFLGKLSSASMNPGSMYRTFNGGVNWSQCPNMQMTVFEGICGIEQYGNT